MLPATPAYVSLYLLSILQASSSPAPVQNAFYIIHWAHDIAGFDSPINHTLPQKVLESAKRRLSHFTSKKLPITPEILQKWIFGGHKIHGHGVIGLRGVLIRVESMMILRFLCVLGLGLALKLLVLNTQLSKI